MQSAIVAGTVLRSKGRRVMRYMRRFTVAVILLLPMIAVADDAHPDLQLTLPPQVDVVPGVEFSIYFDNIVLTQNPEKFKFDVRCDVGKMEQRALRQSRAI